MDCNFKSSDDVKNVNDIFTSVADPVEIGAALKKARAKSGMSVTEVAAAMKTGETAVRRIEAGNHNPSIDTIRRYIDAVDYQMNISFEPVSK